MGFVTQLRPNGSGSRKASLWPDRKLHDCDLHTALSLGSLRQAIAADSISKFAEKQLRELETV
jgi:hypothetical protein